MIDISMSFKFYYLPTFRNYLSVFLIFLFVPGVFGCQHLVGHLEPVERGLRLDGDLERLWCKLFIHVKVHKNNSGFWTRRPLGDDSLWPR